MIISIQSHVAYGYVGNKAAVYPLQAMGYDVCPINTVQFSNHTGYQSWRGEIFSKEHIAAIVNGLEELGVAPKCQAVLSGYIGSAEIAAEVQETAQRFKKYNNDLLYLCDPVIGNNHCYVKPEVLAFFKAQLCADIITPNQFEAEILSDIKIRKAADLPKVAQYFHAKGIRIVLITGVKLAGDLYVFVSDGQDCYLIQTPEYKFPTAINGTGDLFSATYLGSYLATKSVTTALQYAVYFLDKALRNTLNAQTRELQVISVDYHLQNIETTLPQLIKL